MFTDTLGPILSLVYVLGNEGSEKLRDLFKVSKLVSSWIDIWIQVYPLYYIGIATWVGWYNI